MTGERRRIADETEKQRWDRNFADLLQELRVTQAGVQILFAFLLVLPFSNGFEQVTAVQRDLVVDYLLSRPVAIVLAAVTAAWFVAFWLAFPWYRHNWIDEAAEAEDVRVSDGDPTPSDPAA
jgi:TRAP-type C4-dicarboxylate transport system permease small subunit